MRKICITLFLLAVAFVLAPATSEAQEVTDPATLSQIASQLEQIEQEVNRLTLLVTKITLERQAADLQRQLAALMPQREFASVIPVAGEQSVDESWAIQDEPMAGKPAQSPEDMQTSQGPPSSEVFDSEAQTRGATASQASGFAAALGPLGNLGTPQLAALAILAILAAFVLLRRFRGSKQESKASPLVSPPVGGPSFQNLSEAQQSLLQEGRQDLKENVVWK